MPNRPFFPPAWQIAALLDGRATRVIAPVCPELQTAYDRAGDAILRRFPHQKDERLPFAPGDVLAMKETWFQGYYNPNPEAYDPPEPPEIGVLYKADRSGRCLPWRSPVTMPAWAVRLRLRVTDVAVKQVDELDEIEAMQCGLGTTNTRPDRVYSAWDSNPCDELQEHWDQQHARKPGFAFDDGPWVATAKVERVEG